MTWQGAATPSGLFPPVIGPAVAAVSPPRTPGLALAWCPSQVVSSGHPSPCLPSFVLFQCFFPMTVLTPQPPCLILTRK